MRYSGYAGSWTPQPLSPVRRQLLRAAAAAFALTPVLLALAPAVLALALGRVMPPNTNGVTRRGAARRTPGGGHGWRPDRGSLRQYGAPAG